MDNKFAIHIMCYDGDNATNRYTVADYFSCDKMMEADEETVKTIMIGILRACKAEVEGNYEGIVSTKERILN